jgi:glycosyltransferase involved in cell wall biosynthesis
VSNALRDKLLKKYSNIESKVIVVHNSVDISQYNKVSYDESLKKLDLNNENIKIVVFVGHIIPPKGINELLEATSMILKVRKDFKVYFIGTGPHNEEIRFKKYISRNGLNENVFFVGEYSHDVIKYWFRIAHFSILPSYSEGFGIVLIESLSTGTPVIATNVGGIPEIITNKLRGKLVPPRDSKSLAQSMLEFLDKK